MPIALPGDDRVRGMNIQPHKLSTYDGIGGDDE